MLINVKPVSELRSLARIKVRAFETKSVHPKAVEDEEAGGWTTLREGKSSVRLQRPKSKGVLLEDRVWSLLYKMQFDFLPDTSDN
jgi:DNA sulfur modification protein DndB